MLTKPNTITSKVGILVAAAAVAAVGAGCTAPAPVTSQQKFGFLASAYGSYAAGSLDTSSAPSFTAGIGCISRAGVVSTNNGAAATLPAIGDVGAVKSRASSDRNATSVSSNASEDVAATNLLGGLVQAGAIHVASSTSHTALGFHASGATTIPSLVVAGQPISGVIPRNKVITLAGLGTVTLNEQYSSGSSVRSDQMTTGIDIRITVANSLDLPIGTRVIVGSTASGLAGPEQGLLGGVAYGSSITGTGADAGASSSPSNPVGMSCLGTGGQLVTKTQAGANVPNSLSSGSVTDTAQGTITSKAVSAEMTSSVSGANLLSSLVSAKNVKANAHVASSTGKAATFSDAGSQLTNVVVSGHGGNLDNVPANTQLTIPGVGVLYLHRVIRTSASIEVRMIELVVTVGGNNLPIGSDVKVGVAQVSTHG